MMASTATTAPYSAAQISGWFQTLSGAPAAGDLAQRLAQGLNDGSRTVAGVLGSILDGEGHQIHVAPVMNLYQGFFGRMPDAAGLQFWVAAFASGSTLRDIAAAFAGSPEAVERGLAVGGPAGAEFVTGMYRSFLGREPDAAGLQFWVDARVSRAEIITQFSRSPEAEQLLGDANAAFLAHLALRGVAPTATELSQALAGGGLAAVISGWLAPLVAPVVPPSPPTSGGGEGGGGGDPAPALSFTVSNTGGELVFGGSATGAITFTLGNRENSDTATFSREDLSATVSIVGATRANAGISLASDGHLIRVDAAQALEALAASGELADGYEYTLLDTLDNADGLDFTSGFTGLAGGITLEAPDDAVDPELGYSVIGSQFGDFITSGPGGDYLAGGAGADRFVFHAQFGLSSDSHLNTGADRILDLEAGDVIVANLTDVNRFDAASSDFVVTSLWAGGELLILNADGTGNDGDTNIMSGVANPGSLWINVGDEITSSTAASLVAYNITGTSDDDIIGGGQNSDVLQGLGGEDELDGGAGNDLIDGGDGDDQLFGGFGNDWIVGGAGDDFVVGYDDIDGEDGGSDTLEGGAGNDVLIGGYGDDVFVIRSGEDHTAGEFIVGGGGNDAIVFASTLNGDRLVLGSDVNSVDPGSAFTLWMGEDVGDSSGTSALEVDASNTALEWNLHGNDGNNVIRGSYGYASAIYGYAGEDFLTGGDMDDLIDGGDGEDWIDGGGGRDIILGGDGDNFIVGGEDADFITLGTGINRVGILAGAMSGSDSSLFDADTVVGLDADDLIYVVVFDAEYFSVEFNVSVSGGVNPIYSVDTNGDESPDPGDIEVILAGGWAGVAGNAAAQARTAVVLYGSNNNNYLVGGQNNDSISGYAFADYIAGEDGDDILYGGDGDDLLYGGDGHDLLYGEDGDDTLYSEDGDDLIFGGAGADLIIGGPGSNTLIYENASDSRINNSAVTAFGFDTVQITSGDVFDYFDDVLAVHAAEYYVGAVPQANGDALLVQLNSAYQYAGPQDDIDAIYISLGNNPNGRFLIVDTNSDNLVTTDDLIIAIEGITAGKEIELTLIGGNVVMTEVDPTFDMG